MQNHGLWATVSRRYRREHPGDTHPLTGVEMWRKSAAAYGGYHPTDLDAAALAAALSAGDDEAVDAAVTAVLDAAWRIRCAEDEDSPWPPQSIRAGRLGPGHVRLSYGGGRSQAVLDWTQSGATVTVEATATDVAPAESALVWHWHWRLAPWAGMPALGTPDAVLEVMLIAYETRTAADEARRQAWHAVIDQEGREEYIRGVVGGEEAARATSARADAAAEAARAAVWDASGHTPESLEADADAARAAFTAGWRWHPAVSVRIGALGDAEAEAAGTAEALRYLGAGS